MTLLDAVADWVRRVLEVFPPGAATFLSLPVFFAVVIVGVVLGVRKLLPPLGRAMAVAGRYVAVLVGALLLLMEMGFATGFRRWFSRPPTLLYNFGDAVVSGTAGATAAVQAFAAAAGRAARVHAFVLILLASGWLWLWNYQHCPDPVSGCSRPVSAWLTQVGDDLEPEEATSPPAPTKSAVPAKRKPR